MKPANSTEFAKQVDLIKRSGLFDIEKYTLKGLAALRRMDPIEHYLLEGEAKGGRPSDKFDPVYYRQRYSDLGGNISLIVHYIIHGEKEGRQCNSPTSRIFRFPPPAKQSSLPKLLLIVGREKDSITPKAALETAIALQGSFDIQVVLLDFHTDPSDFRQACIPVLRPDNDYFEELEGLDLEYFAIELRNHYDPKYVICAGSTCLHLARSFTLNFVPVLCLLGDIPTAQRALELATGFIRYGFATLFINQNAIDQANEKLPWLQSRRSISIFQEDKVESTQLHDLLIQVKDEVERQKSVFTGVVKDQRIIEELTSEHGSSRSAAERTRLYILEYFFGGSRGKMFPVKRMLRGFDDRAYRIANISEGSSAAPALHYLLAGKPTGSWNYKIIRPSIVGKSKLRVALHIHIHYLETLNGILEAITTNQTRPKIVITTTAGSNRSFIERLLRAKNLTAEIRLVPNRGRDIGPFLTGCSDLFSGNYDLVGHVHGKKSVEAREGVGDTWREFLVQNLLGGRHRAIDIISDAFEKNPKLGLVFPEDDVLNGWYNTFDHAVEIATRAGIKVVREEPFLFPAGNMFWCRPEAVAAITNLNLQNSDYPEEPIPIDGTMLHALERLWAEAAGQAGFEYNLIDLVGAA
jgi:Rhamnan synthesis protein F